MTAQACLASRADPARFARSLAWRLRFWLLGLPAGIGFATLRAILKLWLGFPPSCSGVRSAGNGPAMRSPVLAIVARDEAHLLELVRVSSRVTHSDSRAFEGALVVALACRLALSHHPHVPPIDAVRALTEAAVTDTGLREEITAALNAVARGEDALAYADSRGWHRGISGFINHTVPAALFLWLRNAPDYQAGIDAAVTLGGDTDTVAAIAGALLGASSGSETIPRDWTDDLARMAAERRVAHRPCRAPPRGFRR